jgi:hypothetical protein
VTTSAPRTVADLIGARGLDDGAWLNAIRARIAGLPLWSASVSLIALFDLLVRRMKDDDGKAGSSADALIEERIRQLVESAPPLSQAQRRRLASLLPGAPG